MDSPCIAVRENTFCIGKFLQQVEIVSLTLLGDSDKEWVCHDQQCLRQNASTAVSDRPWDSVSKTLFAACTNRRIQSLGQSRSVLPGAVEHHHHQSSARKMNRRCPQCLLWLRTHCSTGRAKIVKSRLTGQMTCTSLALGEEAHIHLYSHAGWWEESNFGASGWFAYCWSSETSARKGVETFPLLFAGTRTRHSSL